MRIAIASSGLGHVARGIETWARDTAEALAQRGMEVTLFAGGKNVPGAGCRVSRVGCVQRGNAAARRLAGWSPPFLWRWGLKSVYGWEQLTFWLRLWPRLARGRFDVLHVQDPMVACWCNRFRRLGLVKTKEILAHGTEETPEFLERFPCLQHLAPWHLEETLKALGRGGEERTADERRCTRMREERSWEAIPNFVDTKVFRPVKDEQERRECRRKLGIPEDAFVIGTVAAVKKHHKRIDYLIRDFSAFLEICVHPRPSAVPFLAVAGARTDGSDELVRMADSLAPGRTRLLLDLPHDQMAGYYRALDVFVLVSLFEMMPIAVLEALATGLPMITNRHPVLQWMVGEEEKAETGKLKAEKGDGEEEGWDGDVSPFQLSASSPQPSLCGGMCVDLSREGGLAAALGCVSPEWMAEKGRGARRRAETMFSKDVVIGEYVEYYRRVLARE